MGHRCFGPQGSGSASSSKSSKSPSSAALDRWREGLSGLPSTRELTVNGWEVSPTHLAVICDRCYSTERVGGLVLQDGGGILRLCVRREPNQHRHTTTTLPTRDAAGWRACALRCRCEACTTRLSSPVFRQQRGGGGGSSASPNIRPCGARIAGLRREARSMSWQDADRVRAVTLKGVKPLKAQQRVMRIPSGTEATKSWMSAYTTGQRNR